MVLLRKRSMTISICIRYSTTVEKRVICFGALSRSLRFELCKVVNLNDSVVEKTFYKLKPFCFFTLHTFASSRSTLSVHNIIDRHVCVMTLLFMLICAAAAAVVNYQALLTDRSEQLNIHIVYFIFPFFLCYRVFTLFTLAYVSYGKIGLCIRFATRRTPLWHRRLEKLLFHKNYICKRSVYMILEQTILYIHKRRRNKHRGNFASCTQLAGGSCCYMSRGRCGY